MNLRLMGDTGLECSVIGLGTGRLASTTGGISRASAARLISTAQDCGINLIDTADSYGQGECEKVIGAAVQGKRDKFIIVSKAGYTFTAFGGGLRLLKPIAKKILKLLKGGGKQVAGSVRSNVSRQNFSRQAIENSIHASLQRLGTDYLDVFLLHSPPVQVMSDETLFELLRRLKQQGKIRHFGVSSPEPAVAEAALREPGFAVIQMPLSPLHSPVQNALPQLQQSKIGVMANQIFLSGKLLEPGANADVQLQKQKAALLAVASAKGISLNRLAIEYALSRPGVSCVLTGTTNPEHLKQNIADALAPAVLTAEELSRLPEASHV